MKKFLTYSFFLLASSLAFAAFAANGADPVAPYDDYGPATKHADGFENAVEWHNANAATLAASVDEDVIADFVANDAAAFLLLSQVKGAYDTDPVVATQAAAVSQWVMGEEPCWLCFWKPSPAEGRKVWVKALVQRAEKADNAYVKLFCLDQLRWCGCKCPCIVGRISAIGEKCDDKAVKDMVDIVLRTLR